MAGRMWAVMAVWEVPSAGSDVAAAQWTSLAEIESLGLWEQTVRIIRMAEKMRDR